MRKKEVQIYLILWVIIFLMVPLSQLFQVFIGNRNYIDWEQTLKLMVEILPFFVLFLLHDLETNFFIKRKKIAPYVIVTLVLIALYTLYTITHGRNPNHMPGPPPGMDGIPPEHFRDDRKLIHPEIMKIALGFLLIGVNLGVKAFLNGIERERKLQQIKAESLTNQLEVLRYQINPHFFMNTLNNIHALVDIDPEKAKESIEEFSKLMRFVLYEGHAPTIPLSHELEFIEQYVSLMKLRYPENIEISLRLPKNVYAGAQIPPLVLTSYVENAFKHGISYANHSFIKIYVSNSKGKIVFKCTNSRNPSKQNTGHGMGMNNVNARLDLLYGNDYTLHIEEKEATYEILLILPEKP